MKTFGLILLLVLAGGLGQVIDHLEPTPEQIAAFERAAREWPYAFEAQSIGYRNNQEDYEAFVVMQVFRGEGLPDTLYLFDERHNPDNGFACGGRPCEVGPVFREKLYGQAHTYPEWHPAAGCHRGQTRLLQFALLPGRLAAGRKAPRHSEPEPELQDLRPIL